MERVLARVVADNDVPLVVLAADGEDGLAGIEFEHVALRAADIAPHDNVPLVTAHDDGIVPRRVLDDQVAVLAPASGLQVALSAHAHHRVPGRVLDDHLGPLPRDPDPLVPRIV